MKSVVVFGATGFTGRLVARALRELGVADVVLGGRDANKLAELSASLGGVPTRVADATRPETLRALCQGAGVVVDTAGPFIHFGEPVVRAALEAGAHFLDTTGEQAYIVNVREHFDGLARVKSLAVVNAQAFEFALGCCAAALVADSDASIHTIDVFNRVAGASATRGTLKSAIGAIAERGLVFADGALKPRPRDPKPKRVHMPGASRVELSVPFPGSEALFLPRNHANLKNVTTNLVLPDAAAIGAMAVVTAQPALALARRAGLLEPIARRIDKGPEGPTDDMRTRQHFKVFARGGGNHSEKNVLVTGVDPYGITGIIAALGAKLLIEGAPKKIGVVSPDEAFGAQAFLNALEPHGVRVTWS